MRFTSPYRRAVYVVRPAWKELVAGQVERHVGLRAEFNQGSFDSEKAQREQRWTDEQRREVEKYLLEHNDFGKRIFPPKDEMVSQEELRHYGNVGADTPRCIASYETPEGSEPCGRPVMADTDYCPEHSKVTEAV